MKIITILLCFTFIILGCSNSYNVSTNLDQSNFTEYFSPSSVTVFENINDIPNTYKLIGSVEGEDCQLKGHHASPDEIIARTNARKNAFKLKANGIVFSSCSILPKASSNLRAEHKQCLSTLVCYGKAYQVNSPT